MKARWIIGLLLMASSVMAAPGKNFKEVSCSSYDERFTVNMVKQTCEDPRYEGWSPNGCYHFIVTDNDTARTMFDREILRANTYRETQQGYYTLYSYDAEEWIVVGMNIKLNDENRFRLTVRGSSREEMMILAEGNCQFVY